MELFSLLGTIAIDNNDANTAIDDTSEKASSFGEKLQNGIGTVAKWGTAIVGGATAAAGAMVGFASSSAATADNIDKMSQKLGISRQAYQELDFICSQSGTSVDNLRGGMKTLTNVLAEAQQAALDAGDADAALEEQLVNGEITLDEYNQKYDELYEAAYNSCGGLEKLGFSLLEIENMSPEDALYATIEALQAMPDDANRAALAQDLLGKSAQELAPLLNSGVGSMEEMKQMAHDLGLVLDDELIDNGVNLTDSLDQTKRAFQSIITQLGASLMPIVEKVSDYIQQALPSIQALIQRISPILTSLLESLLPPLMQLGESVFPILFDLIEKLIPPITQIIEAILPIIVNLIELLLPPIVQIVEMLLPILVDLLVALLPILEPLMKLLTPLIDLLMVILEPLLQLIEYVLPILTDALVDASNSLLGEFQPALETISAIIGDVFLAALEAIEPVIVWVKNLVNENMDTIEAIFSNIFGIISNIIKFFVALFQGDWEGMWVAVKNILRNAIEYIKNVFNLYAAFIKAIGEKLVTLIKDAFEKIRANMQEKTQAAKDAVVKLFESIKTNMKDKMQSAKDTVLSIFDKIRDGIKDKIEVAKETVRNAIDKIKGFFNFEWKLPDLKLPHFSIEGQFSLNPPSVPTLGIEWYKKAMNDPMLMNSPTAFGINKNGQIMAGGEAGSEVVSGTDTLMQMIQTAVDSQNKKLESILQNILDYLPQLANMQLVTDTGALVGELAPAMDTALGTITAKKNRGR